MKPALRDSSGAAILELTLVVPIILLIVFATLEISRVLRASQIANELSHEASNSIYRKCSDFLEPSGETSSQTVTRTRDCVQDVYNTEFAPLIAQLAPAGSLRIILSLYRVTGGTNVQRFALVNDGPAPRSTKFSANGSSVDSTLPDITNGGTVQLDTAFMAANRRVAIVEVYIQVDPMLRMIPVMNGSVIGGDYYAVSIL